jgi:hypothetical protein
VPVTLFCNLNPTCAGLGSNADLRGTKPSTNLLSLLAFFNLCRNTRYPEPLSVSSLNAGIIYLFDHNRSFPAIFELIYQPTDERYLTRRKQNRKIFLCRFISGNRTAGCYFRVSKLEYEWCISLITLASSLCLTTNRVTSR